MCVRKKKNRVQKEKAKHEASSTPHEKKKDP